MTASTHLTRRAFLRSASAGAAGMGMLALLPASALARLGDPDTKDQLMGLMGWGTLGKGIFATSDVPSGGNTLLVASEGKALLVDTKFPYLAGAILRDSADQIGADITHNDSIDLTLINTHHHADHTGGNAIIVPAASASYAHANAIPRIRAQFQQFVQSAQAGPSQLARSDADERLMPYAKAAAEASATWTEKTAVPRIAISGSGNTLGIGGVKVATKHFGTGHTDNDLVVHLPDHNIVHTGDLVFNGLHPFYDTNAKANARGWIESLTQTRALCDAETTVIPGHGDIAGPEIIDAQIRYFQSLIESIEAEIARGTPKDEITQMRWGFMDAMEFDQLRPRMIGGVYDEIATEP